MYVSSGKFRWRRILFFLLSNAQFTGKQTKLQRYLTLVQNKIMQDSLTISVETTAGNALTGEAPSIALNLRELILRDSNLVDSLVQIVQSSGRTAGAADPGASYIALMAGVMLLTGALGGYANYLNAKPEERHFWKSMVMGAIATITIPLFLKIVDSNLISDGVIDPYSILVFAGFCVLAAFYSAKFLEGLSGRILQNLQQKVEENAQKLNETAAKVEQTDQKVIETAEKADMMMDIQLPAAPEMAESEPSARGGLFLPEASEIPKGPKTQIIAAMGNNLQTLETLHGKTGLSQEDLQKALDEMITEGKIRKVVHRGVTIFGKK
jgi:hypothetical protein